MKRWHRATSVMLVAAAVWAAACSPSVEVIGTTSTSAPESSSSTSAEVALSDLVGDWENGELFLQVADDGSYQALEMRTSDPSDPLMSGFLARDGVNVNFVTDIYGECAGETGVYEALVMDGQLILTLVDDPCEFRANRFVATWERSG
jgi:hypothetical protein